MAAGWLLGFGAIGVWIASHAYYRESIILTLLALLLFMIAIPGSFLVLLL
jgi:hypothetical protein